MMSSPGAAHNDAPDASRLRAGEIKLELALGALLRGKIEATDAHVIEPEVHVGLDRSGALTLPALAPSSRRKTCRSGGSASRTGAFRGGCRVGCAVGAAKILVRRRRRVFAGPFSGRGAAVVGDQLYGYRISGSPTRGGTQIRLGVDPSDVPLTAQFDGPLEFRSRRAEFRRCAGDVAAGRRDARQWQARAQRAVARDWRNRDLAVGGQLQKVTFRYGPEERALNFSASADVTLGRAPRLVGKLSAMGLDVDRALAAPDVTDRPPLVVIRVFLPAFLSEAKLPMRAKIALSVDSLTLGGTTLELVVR